MTAQQNKVSHHELQSVESLLVWLLMCLTVILYGQGLTNSLGIFFDAPHHLANSVFIHDALREPLTALVNPKGFILNYYSYFPAVNIGYYPPVFYTISGLLMFVFGVSSTTVQLTILLFALTMAWCSYCWARLRFPPAWAAMVTLLIMTSPYLVYWGRDIMLELPVLALAIASIWSFELVLREERPRWRTTLVWCLVTVLAIWTKQNAIILVPFYFLVFLAAGRLRVMTQPPVGVSLTIIVAATVGLIALLIYIKGDPVSATFGTSVEHVEFRFRAYRWMFYGKWMPIIVGWALVGCSTLGIVASLASRDKLSLIIPLAWLFSFYVVHSYQLVLDERYALLCLPAFALLSVYGLYNLPQLISRQKFRAGLPATLSWLVMIMLVVQSAFYAARVDVPYVSRAYARAMTDVRDQLSSFTCLTFTEVPSRPASLYRLAIEELLPKQQQLYSYGRILRAVQVLGRRNLEQVTPQHIAQDLKRWNVTMILMERGGKKRMHKDELQTAAILEGVLALGEFDLVSSYSMSGVRSSSPAGSGAKMIQERKLNLYKRRTAIAYNELARPPIHTLRSYFKIYQ